jgi:hypothetical protein
LNGYLHLEQDGSPYAVELNTSLLPRLIAEISIGARGGKEIGGLLIGSLPRAANITLRIDDFVVIPRRETDPARYNLTAEQRARLSTTRRELIDNRTAVLGFFRSHLRREGLALSGDDRKLLTVEFGKAIYVALLVRTQSPYTAGLIVPNTEGVLPSGSAPKELQFNAEGLGHSRTQAFLEASPPAALRVSPTTNERQVAPGQLEHTGIRTITRRSAAVWAFGAAAVILTGLLLTAWAPFTKDLFAPAEHGLRLKAVARGKMLEVLWNRQEPEAQRAGEAILTIQDGSSIRELKLTPTELRTGKLSYQRKGDHVTVWMRVQLPESAELVQSVEWRAQ